MFEYYIRTERINSLLQATNLKLKTLRLKELKMEVNRFNLNVKKKKKNAPL